MPLLMLVSLPGITFLSSPKPYLLFKAQLKCHLLCKDPHCFPQLWPPWVFHSYIALSNDLFLHLVCSLFFLLHDKLFEDWMCFIYILHNSCESRRGETQAGKKSRHNVCEYNECYNCVFQIVFWNEQIWEILSSPGMPSGVFILLNWKSSLFLSVNSHVELPASPSLTSLFIVPSHEWPSVGGVLPKQVFLRN